MGHKDSLVSSMDHSEQVLVVEDNFFSSVALINLLEQYGFDSDCATDGYEALAMVKKKFTKTGSTYALIVMDVYMPICDGFKSLDLIRAYLKEMSE